MASKNGKLLICDICGESVFLEETGKIDLNGGYGGTQRTYQHRPEGWGRRDNSDMCPDCYSEFELLMNQFIYRRREKKDD